MQFGTSVPAPTICPHHPQASTYLSYSTLRVVFGCEVGVLGITLGFDQNPISA